MELLEKFLVPEIYLPIIYVCVAVLINAIIKRIISKIISKKQATIDRKSYNFKKLETFKSLVTNIIKYIIVIFLVLAILTVYKIDVSSVLAGLGIAGLVVGLALQDLAKDLIAGFSIIVENQYAVGDIISIGDFKGEVISLGLKTTKIKSYQGDIKILANRNATEVINYSMSNSLAIVDIDVAYEENNDHVEEVLNSLVIELSKTLPNLKGKVELLGIQELSASSVKYRITASTKAMEHLDIERRIRKAVKQRFDQENIKIPYTQIEVHNGK